MAENKMQMDSVVLRTQRTGEILLLICFVTSELLPFGISLSLSSNFEPTHVLLNDLLEIDIKISWTYLPFLFCPTFPLFAAFVLIYYVIALVLMYMQFLEK